MTTILICDERRTVLDSFARQLAGAPGIDRIGCVLRPDDFHQRCGQQKVDVILLGLVGGARAAIDAVKQVTEPDARNSVLVFGEARDGVRVAAAIAHGARGYLRWEADTANPVVPPPRLPSEPQIKLSERELQVLRGMAQGKSNTRIGEDLFLSTDTIKTHARRLFRKLKANDRAHAVAHGFRHGFVA